MKPEARSLSSPMQPAPVVLNGRPIGPGHPVYLVAELSANHRQEYGEAERLVRAAKDAGADAVKLQTYTPDTITLDVRSELFLHGPEGPWARKHLHDLYREAYMPWEWQPKLKRLADELGLTLFSTPFDPSAVEFLETLGVPAYKIASFELVDLPLIERVAQTGKPVILSTGMATREEIREAVETVRATGNRQLILLKCASAYPAPPEAMNLAALPDLAGTYNAVTGLSDHSLGLAVPVAAVALGASLIEKHFTLSRAAVGPDCGFSLEPPEFRAMAEAARAAWKAIGEVRYGPGEEEAQSFKFRRSLFAMRDIRAGEELTGGNVRSIRPGQGLPPKYLRKVLGRRAKQDIRRGTPLSWEQIE